MEKMGKRKNVVFHWSRLMFQSMYIKKTFDMYGPGLAIRAIDIKSRMYGNWIPTKSTEPYSSHSNCFNSSYLKLG